MIKILLIVGLPISMLVAIITEMDTTPQDIIDFENSKTKRKQ